MDSENSIIWNIRRERPNLPQRGKIGNVKITVERKATGQVEAEALIVPVFQGRRDARFGAADLFDSGEVAGKLLELTLVHHPPGVRATRVLLAGAGKPEKFDSAEMRRLSGAAVRYLKAKSIKNVAFDLEPEFAGDDFASAVVEGAILGDFEPDRYRTGDDKKSIDTFAVAADTPGLDAAVERGRVLAEAQNFSRDLVNEPANRLTPLAMADAARKMAAEFGLECDVLDRDAHGEARHGLAAGCGASAAPNRRSLIVLRYRPASASRANAHLGLVGKGVTFDTGGISIKPADGMEKMKYDMAGGAAMLGAMRAIAATAAGDPGERVRPVRGEHAGQPRAAAGRYRDRYERQDHRGDQYRRRRPADPGGRPHVRAAPGLHASGGCRHAHRRGRGGPGPSQCRPVRQ